MVTYRPVNVEILVSSYDHIEKAIGKLKMIKIAKEEGTHTT